MSLYQIEMLLHSIHYRNVSSLSSDSDHSDQSASASNTPPAERKKPSTSTRQHKGTHKHKVLDKHKKSKKRQRVVSSSSPSSTSSSATSSDSFDSDHVTTTKKHKKKTHHKKHSKKISNKSPRKGKVKHSALMQYANNYLKPYYENESVACDDKLSIAPCSEFINLALVNKGRAIHEDDRFSQASLHGGVDEIRGAITPLELDDIVPSGTRFVLVEGPPGIGKSTLAWELCRKWDTLTSLKHYKMVLLLKLRERRVQNATSLEDLIYHDDKRFRREVVNEVWKCEGEGVLFILDGFDEMSSVIRKENSLIMRLISGSCLPKATRLVTSRPSALKSYFPQGFRHVEVCGFTDECKVRFAEIAFKSEPKVLAHFKDFIFSNPVINSLMYIPVNCAIIAQVYKDIRKSRELMPKTMTQLYTTLTLVLIRRHMISSGQWDKHSKVPSSLKDLPESVSIDLERVSQLACSGLFEEDVQLVFTDSDVGEDFQHLGLMNAVKEMYVCEGAATSYSFLHLSIQEFLAAWYVSCHSDLVDEASKTVSQFGQVIPHLKVFGQFLCGIVGYIEKIFQGIKTQFSYLMHCLYEIRDISELKLNIKTFYIQLSTPLRLTTPLDVYVFGYCLVHVPIQCQKVSIHTSLEMLVHSLSEHTKKTNGGTLGTIKNLHIDVHDSVHVSSKLTSLTKYFPKFHINSLTLYGISSPLVPVLSDWISKSSPGLTSIALKFSESCEDDCLLYQSIQHITNLQEFSLVCRTPTRKGVQELCKIISTSSTLTKLVLQCHPALLSDVVKALLGDPSLPTLGDPLPYKRSELFTSYELYPVLQAALSSSTISTLKTNFGCRVCTNAGSIEHVTLESHKIHPLEMLRSFQYLSCVAEMNSKSISAQVHNIDDILFAMPHFCCNFIMSLNDSLHHSTENLNLTDILSSRYFTPKVKSNPPFRDCMARALRRDPAVPRHNLRRSQSLCDFRTLHFPHRHQLLQQHDSPRPLPLKRYHSHPSYGWRHIPLKSTGNIPFLYQSCPDLLEMQALQNMHPLLQKVLRCYELYYR